MPSLTYHSYVRMSTPNKNVGVTIFTDIGKNSFGLVRYICQRGVFMHLAGCKTDRNAGLLRFAIGFSRRVHV